MLTKKQKDDIRRKQDWECKLCGRSIKSGSEIHHIDHDKTNDNPKNLIAIHRKCHNKITPHAKKPKSWLFGG